MGERRSVNLRFHRSGTPMVFGSEETRREWEREVSAIREAMRVDFAIAPRVTLPVPRGVLQPGEEVRREDIVGVDGSHDVHRWRDLLARRFVLARED